ncbi:MAG: hydroxymethylglutaryl-CoA synthase family protein [Deltaproteobacteria bacterium]|nr:hydroxymethylglutaryl-CoA synthase family protein [Deltaproteobacteria bacterium]
MIGITSYGVYTPYYRLDRDSVRKAWGSESHIKGQKAIANYDEDPLTMASEAVSDCLTGCKNVRIDALNFASTHYPFTEKQGAAMIACISDFPEEIATTDFTHSMRAGASALKGALDAAGSGSAGNVMVASADCRVADPGSDLELITGDGSAALLISDTDLIAEFIGSFSMSHDFSDFQRNEGETCFHRMDDLRFVSTYGYKKNVSKCIMGILQKYNLKPGDISKLICPSIEPGVFISTARKMGFDPVSQLQDPFFDKIGYLGSVHPLLMLAAALDEAEADDKILMIACGDGAEAFVFEVTPEINRIENRGRIAEMINGGIPFTNYPAYLSTRNSLEKEERSLRPYISLALNEREGKQNVRRYGSKCRECGFVQFPMRRICMDCGAKDRMDDYRIAASGEIFTYTREYYIPFPPMNPPMAMVVVDMDGGGRLHIQMTDHEFDEVKIGTKVRLTYRKLFEAGDTTNYFWKCAPVQRWR